MKKLTCSDIENEYLKNTLQVCDEDIKMINQKTRCRESLAENIVLIAIFGAGAVYSLLYSRETLPACCILVLMLLWVLKRELKKQNVTACYAVVTEKKERWAKENAKKKLHVLPYEQTDCIGSSNRKQHLFYNIRSYYFCSVDINGEVFEHVCCYDNDYDKIEVGDTVVIGGNTGLPIVYRCETSEIEN